MPRYANSIWKLAVVLLTASPLWALAPAAAPATNQQQQGSFWIVLAVWMMVFLVAMLAGYAVGKARSVDFTNPKSDRLFQQYVAAKVTESFAAEPRRGPAGELVELTPVWTFRFASGIYAHVYDTGTGKHHLEASKQAEVDFSDPPRNGLSFGQVMTAVASLPPIMALLGPPVSAMAVPVSGFAATTTANALPNYASLVSNANGSSKIRLIFFGLVGLASGVYLGYRLGYRNQPKLGAERLDRLLNDDLFWHGVATIRNAESRTWTFESRGAVILVKRSGDADFANVSPFGSTIAAVPKTPGLTPGAMGFLGVGPVGGLLTGNRFLAGSLLTSGFQTRLATAPPADLIALLQRIGELHLAQQLTGQVGKPVIGALSMLNFPAPTKTS